MITPTPNTFDYYVPVLCIAGSDPSGGAGLQVDLKTCEAFGCYGMAVVSGLTAQSPYRVTAVQSVSDFMEAQLKTLLNEVRPSAVKIGMLPDVRAVETTATAIEKYGLNNVTIDPVMVSTSGHTLTDSSYIGALTTLLLPHCTLVTPNVAEAKVLTGIPINNTEDCRRAAVLIANQYGCPAVLVKGGHIEGSTTTEVLYTSDSDSFYTFSGARINTPNTHGTGCRLSTAIACGLACGQPLPIAVEQAKNWLAAELRRNACYRFPKPLHTSYL